MFLLIPLTALIFFILFYKGSYYLQHLVFVLHLQSVVFLIFILMNLIELLVDNTFTGLLKIFLFLFVLLLWIRKFYGLTWLKTVWKTILFLVFYSLSLMIFFILVATLSALSL